jgi:hypothetical protein
MRKKAVQQGRSEQRGESYSGPYVEPLSDARTLLAVFSHILLHMPKPRDQAHRKSVDTGYVSPRTFTGVSKIVSGEKLVWSMAGLRISRPRTRHVSRRIRIRSRILHPHQRPFLFPHRLQLRIGAAVEHRRPIAMAIDADVSRSTPGIDIRHRRGVRPLI